MDVNDFRSVVTLVSFVVFLGIWRWAYKRSNKDAFAEAAALPFMDSTPSGVAEGEKK